MCIIAGITWAITPELRPMLYETRNEIVIAVVVNRKVWEKYRSDTKYCFLNKYFDLRQQLHLIAI